MRLRWMRWLPIVLVAGAVAPAAAQSASEAPVQSAQASPRDVIQAARQVRQNYTSNVRLTLEELLQTVKYAGAPRLIVLSACESGLVDVERDPNEFIGLPAAFLADAAVERGDITDTQGETLSGALLEAAEDPPFADPRFWGAWVYYGA